MAAVRFVRFSGLLVLVTLLGLLALSPSVGTLTSPRTSVRWAPVSTWVPPNPTNAGKIFRWGNATWHDEFIAPLSSQWSVNRPALVRNQHGMLTLDSAATGADVVARLKGQTRQYGRWEARVRARQYATSGTPYRVVWELIPTDGYHCGAKTIELADFTLGTNVATMHLRNLPGTDSTDTLPLQLSDNEFHTFAVEVTPDHISWFVDTKVIRTETRPQVLTGSPYAVRFRLASTPGATMNRGRMQMDWARYYTLARPDAQPITAPLPDLTSYAGAC